MPADDVTGGPKELATPKLIHDARLLRAKSQRLIHESNLLLANSWELFARVLKRYIEPRSE